ncbi:N-sulfoglucosamine sulfohydrolase [Flavobacteriaceae bacterium UJ101]|nr:N-sulfoglucosamine sulfohydrolase [Flavobacteriaceae bacterium UJ101]
MKTKLLLLLFSISSLFLKSQEKPNILFIIADDLGKYLPMYGDRQAQAPTIEKIGENGLIFDRAYSNFPVCGPSRASMLTGLYPETIFNETGKGYNNNDLKTHELADKILKQIVPDGKTLMNYLKTEGNYYVLGGGKIYHSAEKSQTNDYSKMINTSKLPAYSKNKKNKVIVEDHHYTEDYEHRDGYLANNLEKKIREYANGIIGDGKPLFMTMGLQKPHGPYAAPTHYFNDFPIDRTHINVTSFFDQPNDVLSTYTLSPAENILKNYKDVALNSENYVDIALGQRFSNLKPELQKKIVHGYYTCISFIDQQIKKVVDVLKEKGLYDNTIIIITSDHGYKLGHYDRLGKYSTHETDTSVPLIISGPGITSNTRTSSIAQLIDLFPTLCDLTSTPIPDWIQGTSLKPILSDPTQKVNQYSYTVVNKGGSWLGKSIINDEGIRYTKYVNKLTGDYIDPPGKSLSQELYDYSNEVYTADNKILDNEYAPFITNLSEAINSFFTTGNYAKVVKQNFVYEAEDAEISGKTAIVNCNTSSNQKHVKSITSGNNHAVTFNNIMIDEAGTYNMNLHYFSNSSRTFSTLINGNTSNYSIPKSGKWCYQGGTPAVKTISINLNRGMNTIKIYNIHSLDKIELDKVTISAKKVPLPISTTIQNQLPSKPQIAIYPNIVNKGEFIKLKNVTKFSIITLYNSNGQLVYKNTLKNSSSEEIPTSKLQAGLYFVKIINNKQIFNSKIMIK